MKRVVVILGLLLLMGEGCEEAALDRAQKSGVSISDIQISETNGSGGEVSGSETSPGSGGGSSAGDTEGSGGGGGGDSHAGGEVFGGDGGANIGRRDGGSGGGNGEFNDGARHENGNSPSGALAKKGEHTAPGKRLENKIKSEIAEKKLSNDINDIKEKKEIIHEILSESENNNEVESNEIAQNTPFPSGSGGVVSSDTNSGEGSVSIILPQLTITTPSTSSWLSSTTSTIISGTKNKEATQVYINNSFAGVTYSTDTSWQSSVSLSEGQNLFEIYAKNSSGNKSATSSVTILYDTTPPPAPVVVATNNMSTSTSSTVDISWSSSDSVSGIGHYNVEYKASSSSSWLPLLTQTILTSYIINANYLDSYDFRTQVIDLAGNVSDWGEGRNLPEDGSACLEPARVTPGTDYLIPAIHNEYYWPVFNDLEELGLDVGGLNYEKIGVMYNYDSNAQTPEPAWLQFIQQKQTDGTYSINVVDLGKGVLKDSLTGIQAIKVARTYAISKTEQSKIYLSTFYPGELISYDALTGTFENLGTLFQNDQAAQSSQSYYDGTIVFGGIGTAEASMYDPSTGVITKYGKIGPGGYAYTIGASDDAIHVAVRATNWEWYSVDKTTGEQTLVFSQSNSGQAFMSMGYDGYASIRFPDGTNHTYRYSNGTLDTNPPTYNPPASLWETPSPTTAPVVSLSKTIENNQAYLILTWTGHTLNTLTGIVPSYIRSITKHNGKIYMMPSSYGVLASYDLDPQVATDYAADPVNNPNPSQLLGFVEISIKEIISSSSTGLLVGGGYPSASLFKYDADQPFVYTEETPRDAFSNSNPARLLVGSIHNSAHDMTGLFDGVDGKIYYLAHLDRFFSGYRIGRTNLSTGVYEEVSMPSETESYLESWMSHSSDGRYLFISAYNTETYESIIIKYDISTNSFQVYHPKLDGNRLVSIHLVNGQKLYGIAIEPVNGAFKGTGTFFEMDTNSGCVTKIRTYAGMLTEVPVKGTLPRLGHSFTMGPDGYIWAAYNLSGADSRELIYRIDPSDFSVDAYGTVDNSGAIHYVFDNGYAYISGESKLRRFVLP